MKISYQWLLEYVATTLSPAELAERFRFTSSEVEGLQEWESTLRGLIVGRVEEVKSHPTSQKLHIAIVNTGEKRLRQIVCGAPNLAEQQLVVVALPGTTIHPIKGEPITISEATIRGVVSAGMLCAYNEIGLNLTSEGIIVLEGAFNPGYAAVLALHLNDTVLNLEITPNRPDLLSYYGLAREVSTFDHKRLSEVAVLSLGGNTATESPATIRIMPVDHHLCRRYSTLCLDNCTVAPSPYWLQRHLLLSGIRPINNIVDVTNYVMLELGQPLHAFDRSTLTSGTSPVTISIRHAHHEEPFSGLDGYTRNLVKQDIVVVDTHNHIIALAGVMGGSTSSIQPHTTHIVLESAIFDGAAIRRTSRQHSLRTEASTRMEKGLDPETTITALKRAAYLLQEIAGAHVSSTISDSYPHNQVDRPKIHLNYTHIQQVLGVHLSPAECRIILQKLGFHLTSLTKSSIDVQPPSWRADIQLPEDVMEELLRIWGYDRLPTTLPLGPIRAPQKNAGFEAKRTMRHTLARLGLHECITLSLVSAQTLERCNFPIEQAVRVKLPLSKEGEYLLPAHGISLLHNASTYNREQDHLALFEIGSIFTLPHQEEQQLSMLLRSPDSLESMVRHLKAIVNEVISQIHRPSPTYEPTTTVPPYLTAESLTIKLGSLIIGSIGIVNQSTLERWKIRSTKNILLATLNLGLLLQQPVHTIRYQPASVHPIIERDVTITIPEALPVGAILTAATEHHNSDISQPPWLTTIYRGQPLLPTEKSITLHIIYRANHTLADEEVNADLDRLTQRLLHTFSGHLTN